MDRTDITHRTTARQRSRRAFIAGAISSLGILTGRPLLAQPAEAEQPRLRPFGPKAPWNVRVEHLPQHPDSKRLVGSMFLDDRGLRTSRFQVTIDTHTYPVHDAATSLGPTPIKVFWPTNLVGKMPWNPAWKPAAGPEAALIVLDAQNGLEWDLDKVDYRLQVINAAHANMVSGDYRTKEDGFLGSRGSGLPFLAGLVRPEEVQAGVIEHALSMSVPNISGSEFVAPALKAEFPHGAKAGIPAGTRFALRVTDQEIDVWLNSLPQELTLRTRETAKILAVALRDYGWFITETSPSNLFHLESRVTAEKDWLDLGLQPQKTRRKEYPRDLVDAILTSERIVAIAPSDQYPEEWRAA
ncbi:hypothetical protein GC163_21280 [bacterium]|nr:hypothetical protein [bacterium]